MSESRVGGGIMAVGNVKNQVLVPGPDLKKSEISSTPESEALRQTQTTKTAKVPKGLGEYQNAAKISASVKDAANVQISQKAKDLSLIKKTMAETPDVREDKVAHFKSLIDSGKYKPDAGKIADGILKEAILDDLSKTPEIALQDE
jgi:negative regulator of flagellin synthesis FlgM